MNTIEANMRMLTKAQVYANAHSTCCKVQVGSLIVTENYEMIYGANHGIGYNCSELGCNRVRLYGENSKEHRLPSDCVSIHSEIDAISNAARLGICLDRATIFVTRYPCEACARAIAQSGIRKVVYGRLEPIPEGTLNVFEYSGVIVSHCSEATWQDDNR